MAARCKRPPQSFSLYFCVLGGRDYAQEFRMSFFKGSLIHWHSYQVPIALKRQVSWQAVEVATTWTEPPPRLCLDFCLRRTALYWRISRVCLPQLSSWWSAFAIATSTRHKNKHRWEDMGYITQLLLHARPGEGMHGVQSFYLKVLKSGWVLSFHSLLLIQQVRLRMLSQALVSSSLSKMTTPYPMY